MITLGEEQSLGFKALLIRGAKSLAIGLFFIFLALFIIFLRTSIVSGLNNNISGNNSSGINISAASSNILMILSIIFFCAGVFVFFIGLVAAYLKQISFSYTLNSYDLVIKTGILHKKENAILYRQIKDVNIERSLLHQLFGLSKIDITTSETDARNEEGITRIYLDYIDSDVAKEIRDIVTKKVGIPLLETRDNRA